MTLVPRQRVAAYGLARRGVSILVVRASTAVGGERLWWLPGGGVRFGESPTECLAREFLEESGLRVLQARLRDALSDVWPVPTESTLLHSVRLIYDVEVGLDAPLVEERDGSTDEVAWCDESRLTQLPLAPWLRSYLTGPWRP